MCIDGDDPDLKRLAIPIFKKEIFEHTADTAIRATTTELEKLGYKSQVHQREINLFYLADELRERIVEDGNGYAVLNTSHRFTKKELLAELESNPERFSPNVVLRPVYQELILPNLAYIGGGGELAYWFQLKGVFEAFELPFPIIMLRNSALLIPSALAQKMESLGIKAADLFTPAIDLENVLIRDNTNLTLDLDREREQLEATFLEMEGRMREIDPKLERSVQSAWARTDRMMRNLEKKMLRAERKKQEVIMGRLESVRELLMPRGGLQERNLNFAPLYIWFGAGFIESLLEQFDPFEAQFAVFTELS